MRKDKFRLTPDYLPTALRRIQTAHHEAFYPKWPMANLNLDALGDTRAFNADFVLVEVRNASLFVRRTLKRDQSGGKPPYSTMETRQLMGDEIRLERLELLQYTRNLAEAIYEAGKILSDHDLDLMADPDMDWSGNEKPRWLPVDRETVITHLQRFIEFCQSSALITLVIRYSNRTGLTLRTFIPKSMEKSAPSDIQVQQMKRWRDNVVLTSRFSMTSYE